MAATRFNPPSGRPRSGRAFNHGVVEPEGRRVHVTGQVAWDETGAVVGAGDYEAQTRKAFENVAAILAAVGRRLDDIVTLTIDFVGPAGLPTIQKMRAQFLAAETSPASILIGTPALVSADLLVELVPIAVVPFERSRAPHV